MKKSKNKKTLLFGVFLCLGLIALGTSIAYNHDSSTIPNEFGVGEYRTIFTEQFTSPDNWKPCDETTKTFTVKNETDADIKVRIKYDEVWRNAGDTRNLPLTKDNVTLANVILRNTNDWELKGDGYYYYKNALAPNAITSSLFQKVVLDCNANFGADNVCTETATGTVCTKPNDDYEGATYHLKITAETVQADGADEEWAFALLNTGKNVNQALKSLAGNSSASYSTTNSTIKSLAIVDELPNTINPTTAAKKNIAKTGSGLIYAYFDGTDSIYIHADGRTLYANEDSSYMFSNMQALTSLTLPSSFDTSRVKNMERMFYYMRALTSLALSSSFDTSSVTNMRGMFDSMFSLTSLTLPSSFDTSNVTNMGGMFSFEHALVSLTLPDSFDTSNVTNMSSMFRTMLSLTSLTLPSSFDTSNVTSIDHMFYDMTSLVSLTLPSSFNISNVTFMNSMFSGMSSLTSLTLPTSFIINSGTSTSGIFYNVPSTATLNSTADQSVKNLWSPRPLRN